MTQQYPLLTYRGNITSSEDVQPGKLCGWDETYRPYEVIEAMYNAETDTTELYLQYALPETVRAQADEYRDKLAQRGVRI